MKKEDGGPAFPFPHQIIDANDVMFKMGVTGMSLRDYFASVALQSLITIPSQEQGIKLPGLRAKRAYQYADAMIAERSK